MGAGIEYTLTMKQLPRESRPRERLLHLGPQALSSAELLALVLGTGSRGQTALDLAHNLLRGCKHGWGNDGLRGLHDASVEELGGLCGMGDSKGARVKAALELGRRLTTEMPESGPVVTTPQDAAALVLEDMRFLDREQFRLILLSSKNRVIGLETGFIGSLNASLVHPRELFRTCIRRSAAAVVLVHNHPSGDPSPSQEDLDLTCRLQQGGEILGIEVLDHIIVGDGQYLSMREKGLV